MTKLWDIGDQLDRESSPLWEINFPQCINLLYLKLPSLFAAWLFWTFHTKSHNMEALVILSHSWSPFLPLTCSYGKNKLLWVSVWPSGVFSWEKTPPRLLMQITWPWPPVGRFCHGLITVSQKKMCGYHC